MVGLFLGRKSPGFATPTLTLAAEISPLFLTHKSGGHTGDLWPSGIQVRQTPGSGLLAEFQEFRRELGRGLVLQSLPAATQDLTEPW